MFFDFVVVQLTSALGALPRAVPFAEIGLHRVEEMDLLHCMFVSCVQLHVFSIHYTDALVEDPGLACFFFCCFAACFFATGRVGF